MYSSRHPLSEYLGHSWFRELRIEEIDRYINPGLHPDPDSHPDPGPRTALSRA